MVYIDSKIKKCYTELIETYLKYILKRELVMYDIIKVTDSVYDERYSEDCLIDFVIPRTDHTVPVLIYFHGGGLESGNRRDGFIEEFVREYGIAVATADYRMYPNARFPEFIRDAACATEFVWNYGKSTGLFHKFFIGGSSAGAYLTMMLYFCPVYMKEYIMHPDMFDGYIFDAGQPTTHFNVLRERGIDPKAIRIDEAAPVFFVDNPPSSPAKRPPVLIITAENDMQGRQAQNDMLMQTMLAFGYSPEKIDRVMIRNCGHCEYVGKRGEDGKFMVNRVYADFILKYNK